MKTIITGSRHFDDYQTLCNVCGIRTITEVVSGGALGADRLGERFAAEFGIPVKKFRPQYNTLGKRALYINNKRMVNYADAIIAFWDGYSKETKHLIFIAKQYNLEVYVHALGEVVETHRSDLIRYEPMVNQ